MSVTVLDVFFWDKTEKSKHATCQKQNKMNEASFWNFRMGKNTNGQLEHKNYSLTLLPLCFTGPSSLKCEKQVEKCKIPEGFSSALNVFPTKHGLKPF